MGSVNFNPAEAAQLSAKWLTDRLEYFRPFPTLQLHEETLKAFGELAVTYECLRRWSLGPSFLGGLNIVTWRDFLIRRVCSIQYQHYARRSVTTPLLLLLPYLVLRGSGFRESWFEETLVLFSEVRCLNKKDILPYRRLEFEYIAWRGMYMPSEPDWRTLLERTLLSDLPRITIVNTADAYAITHAIFYLTDWGHRDLPISRKHRNRICDVLYVLLVHFFRIGLWDVAGELLMSSYMVVQKDTDLLDYFAITFFNLPTINGSMFATAKHWRSYGQVRIRKESHFRLCYHTTLVRLLLCGIIAKIRD